jgi:tetratricopeptide (TPR) repeat protein
LIENVVGLAENLEPVALIGAGGIGKTAIALSVLHHERIKKRFGDNRRFICCDQFPSASRPHLLSKLSKAIGAGIENPEDLTPLRPFLSSKEMILFLDNAESILDPQGIDAREVYTVVEELSRFGNICLCITSRISTVPPHCKRPTVSTLSMGSACDIFYGIYENGGRSDIINDLVKQLDFHALSITLLATTASHNMWSYNRLAKEWNIHRGRVLRTDYNESLAATVELSLDSPTFCKLGSNARDLLGVIAFFPQGINEDNVDWLFPTITDRSTILDKLCVLSLTYRSNGFITMLAPIRDYLRPTDPELSPLLCATKDNYFSRLLVKINRARPGFEEGRWIVGEDANVEHLLDIFTSIDTESAVIWDVCSSFLSHLYCHKSRSTVLGQKIEGLPDGHSSKPKCFVQLSRLSRSAGNYAEQKRLLTHALKLERQRGDDHEIARILGYLSGSNKALHLRKEGIQQAKEALQIYERLGDTAEQANCLDDLSRLFHSDGQLDAAEEAASRAIDLLPKKGQELRVCQSHRTLGGIYRSMGKREKAIHHLKIALEIGSLCKWDHQLCWINHSLAKLFYDEGRLDDANTHIEKAKSHAVNGPCLLGRMMEMQAKIWHRQGRLEDAMSEVSRALEIFEELGAPKYAGDCKSLLRKIEQAIAGELLETMFLPMYINPHS